MLTTSDITDKSTISNYFTDGSEFLNLLQPLLTALQWQGRIRDLLEALPEQRFALDITGLIEILTRLKYTCNRQPANLLVRKSCPTPLLLVPQTEPAMLVLTINANQATVFNSVSQCKKIINRKQLARKGSIYTFTAQNADHLPELPHNTQPWLTAKITKLWPLASQILFISFLLSVFAIAPPIFIMASYDQVLAANSLPMLLSFAGGALLILLSGIILQRNRAKIIAILTSKIEQTTIHAIFNKILHLAPKYTETSAVGSQLARIKDFEAIKDFFNNPLTATLFELPAIIVALLVILLLNSKLFLLNIAAISTFAVVFWLLNIPVKHLNQRYFTAHQQRLAFQTEALSNLRTIKADAKEAIWQQRYRKIFAHTTVRGMQANFFAAVINIIADSLMLLAGALVIWLGTLEVLNNQLSIGALLAIMMLTWRVLNPLKVLFNILLQLAQMKLNILQVDKLFKLETEQTDQADQTAQITAVNALTAWPAKQQPSTISSVLEFDKVSFRYHHDDPPALTTISFQVDANEVVCITGRNGSGKSTLLKLVDKIYPPQRGLIKLGGVNIQQLDPILLRQTISYLPQTPQLFNTTIEQNLLFANPIATKAELEHAAKLAGIYEEIMQLPLQLQTPLLNNEHNLLAANSFKQRLALARTFVRNSALYLLDEPTNSLDDTTIIAFMDAIDYLRQNANILIVTHQQEILDIADRVLYLDHSELIKDESITEKLLNKFSTTVLTAPSSQTKVSTHNATVSVQHKINQTTKVITETELQGKPIHV